MNIEFAKDPREATLITHGGTFHSADILSTVLLGKLFDKVVLYRTNEISRRMHFRKDAIIMNVGFGEFDPHNPEDKPCRPNGISYRAPGLIWKKFGYDIIIKQTKIHDISIIEEIFNSIEKKLIIPVDYFDTKNILKEKHPIDSIDINKIISCFNPNWDDTQSFDEAFIDATYFMEVVFDKYLSRVISKIKARDIVEKAIDYSQDGLMFLPKFVPWLDSLLISKNPKAESIQFVIYPSLRSEGYNWQCIPLFSGSNIYRKDVPVCWRGLHGFQLRQVTGVPTATFCHPSGYLGGAKTLQDTIAFARKAINS